MGASIFKGSRSTPRAASSLRTCWRTDSKCRFSLGETSSGNFAAGFKKRAALKVASASLNRPLNSTMMTPS